VADEPLLVVGRTAPAARPGSGSRSRALVVRGRHVGRTIGVYAALLLLVVVVAGTEPVLLHGSSIQLLLRQVSVLGLLAVGQTVVMLTGGIDLSVGSVVLVVNLIAASMLDGKDSNNLAAIAVCLGIGAAVGIVNGSVIALFRVPPFVMTLGALFAVEAAGLVYTNGITRGNASPFLIHVGQRSALGIPIAFLVMLGVALAVHVALRTTPFGRRVFAIGANPRAAYLAGLAQTRALVGVYVISGLAAALGGLLLTGYIELAATTSGEGMELQSIAAVVIGGTALSGGRGSVVGSVGGVLFLGLLFNLLNVLDIPEAGRLLVQGGALVLAGAVYAALRARERAT
jgi:ribose/xylose/arabinose/galactoside ABC-type transport system permease subunit